MFDQLKSRLPDYIIEHEGDWYHFKRDDFSSEMIVVETSDPDVVAKHIKTAYEASNA